MPQSHITIHVAHPEYEPGPIRGFRFFWAYYLNGYDQTFHCQPCFKGSLSAQFNTRGAQSGKLYTMNERRKFRYLYVCGVGIGPKDKLKEKNFHLPLEYRAGAGETGETYNGYTITVETPSLYRYRHCQMAGMAWITKRPDARTSSSRSRNLVGPIN